MLKNDSISKFRSEVIERTINIEWLMNIIISQNYFGKILEPFVLEFLYDEYCSFALKRRVLEKILPDFDNKILQDLNRVNTIRNYFAHCNQVFIDGSDPTDPSAISKVVDPRRIDKSIDFEALYKEFMGIAGQVEEYLRELYVAIGGALLTDDDFKKTNTRADT